MVVTSTGFSAARGTPYRARRWSNERERASHCAFMAAAHFSPFLETSPLPAIHALENPSTSDMYPSMVMSIEIISFATRGQSVGRDRKISIASLFEAIVPRHRTTESSSLVRLGPANRAKSVILPTIWACSSTIPAISRDSTVPSVVDDAM